MQGFKGLKFLAVAVCILLAVAEMASSAPSYSDYENVRELYELLLQKEALENRLGSQQQQLDSHEVVRKSNRSPSLRLRFGRRADPMLTATAFSEHSAENAVDNNNNN